MKYLLTGSVYWSETSYTTINWEAIDENGTIWYESSVTILQTNV